MNGARCRGSILVLLQNHEVDDEGRINKEAVGDGVKEDMFHSCLGLINIISVPFMLYMHSQ